MALKQPFELHHCFPKLAEDSCFTFNTHRTRNRIDWNKIRLIDINSLIKERKFTVIEQHLSDILDCVFESEFDVRILDEGVMKMFRLAQLAVEYQQFCRQYLDRSVYVLREEITNMAKELDTCKKELREKDEEIRKLRKRSKQAYKTPLPYGNDNIATMILKTLSQQKGELFPSTSADIIHYNKCDYCDKVFLNQLYLKSHINRRHLDVTEEPQKDKDEKVDNKENTKLIGEVTELKDKIKELETIIEHTTSNITKNTVKDQNKDVSNDRVSETKKDTKDAEVSTNKEDYLLDKIEEWKKKELENYNKEMDKLRNQVMETINALKNHEKKENNEIVTQPNLTLQLHETIKEQGSEILALRKELNNAKLNTDRENAERNKEAEAQITFWTNRAEAQSKQYELLLQKMNDIAKCAQESRALAEAERERASQLQELLQQTVTKQRKDISEENHETQISNHIKKTGAKKKTTNKNIIPKKSKSIANNEAYEILHRRAQELLNMDLTSTNSDTSSADLLKEPPNVNKTEEKRNKPQTHVPKPMRRVLPENIQQHKNKDQVQKISLEKSSNIIQKPVKELKKLNEIDSSKGNHTIKIIPASPLKVVRAKITEEVNNRLVSSGVDPLKHRLSKNVFQKQRMQLHRQIEIKAKKNPAHERTRHHILAYLDSNTSVNKEVPLNDYVSPTRPTRSLKNLTSIISNVKTKALSLVKLSDTHDKATRKNRLSEKAEVSERAMTLLKTPPESNTPSPVVNRRQLFKANKNQSNIAQNTNNASAVVATKSQNNRLSKGVGSTTSSPKPPQISSSTKSDDSYSEGTSEDSIHNHPTASVQQVSKSIEHLIKSPARRPSSATADYNHTVRKYTISDNNNLLQTQSATNLNNHSTATSAEVSNANFIETQFSTDDEESAEIPVKKNFLIDNIENGARQTKSVLKNASSTSSLNKKKVLFDMDAIQMKSVSASPSQSITEKSDEKEKYGLGLINLDGEEWDISSIEDEPLKNDTKIQNVIHHPSPKIAELKEKIESQLARRNETALTGGVDVLTGNMVKTASVGGSNTSLGSSILDDSESTHIGNQKPVVKPKLKSQLKDDGDIDVLSEFSIDGIVHKNESF